MASEARQAQQVVEGRKDRYMYSKEKKKSEGRKELKKRSSLKRQWKPSDNVRAQGRKEP